jgi:outer membrane biosynthesis protein TonB
VSPPRSASVLSSTLTHPPAHKHHPAEYPLEAFDKEVVGTVIVEILIGSTGRVVRARVQCVPLAAAVALDTVYE